MYTFHIEKGKAMNRLSFEKRVQILNCLVEGCSLRATSRMVDVSLNTVTGVLIELGTACSEYQDRVFRNLKCQRVQLDEIWSFVYCKQKNVKKFAPGERGDLWTWIAIDSDTRLVPSWLVG